MRDLGLCTGAFMGRVVEMPAGTRVHGSYEHEVCWVGDALIGASDGDGLVLKRLT